MNCESCRPALVAFHAGESRGDERDELEVHLRGCAACVRELLELKRAFELAEEGPAPAPSSRVKLREAVEAEFGVKPAWWERPLAGLVGAASVVAAILLVAP